MESSAIESYADAGGAATTLTREPTVKLRSLAPSSEATKKLKFFGAAKAATEADKARDLGVMYNQGDGDSEDWIFCVHDKNYWDGVSSSDVLRRERVKPTWTL